MWMRWGLGRGTGRVGGGNGGEKGKGGLWCCVGSAWAGTIDTYAVAPFYRHTPLALGRV